MVATAPVIAHVGNFFQTQGFATNFDLTSPTVGQFALQAGDLVCIAVRWQTSGAPNPPQCTGFTTATAPHTSNTTHRVQAILVKPLPAAADATAEQGAVHNVSLPGISGTRCLGQIFIVRGADLTSLVAGTSAYLGTAITNGIRMASFALSAPGPWLALAVGGAEHTANKSATPTTRPTGWTTVKEGVTDGAANTSRTSLVLYSLEHTASPVANTDIVWSSGPTAPNLIGVALRGKEEAPPPDLSGAGLTVLTGSGAPGKLWYTNPAGEARTPNAIAPMPLGFRTVSEVLATPGFTMAHRGNSTRYPEMSMHAYTQAVQRGYGLLEVSVARSSDGVFFGLHDDTLTRTSPGAPATSVSAMTWAQIQAWQNTLGVHGAPAPYMRLDDFVAAYGSSHVGMFDPKTMSGPNRQAMYSYLLSTLGTDRAIVKYYGGGPEIALEAQAHGFLTWGFFYASNVDAGIFASDQGPWDILGMEYNVAQSYWDTVLATGKPTIAHIAPSQAAYDMAISKGADGVQVSASHLVAAVSSRT